MYKQYHNIILISTILMLFAHTTHSFAQQITNKDLNHYVNAENLRKAGQYEKALSEYRRAISYNPRNHVFLYSKAIAELELQETDSAIMSLNKSIHLKPDDAPSYALLAQAHYHKDDPEKFIAFYDSAAKYEQDLKQQNIYHEIIMNNYIKNKDFEAAYKRAKILIINTKEDLKVNYIYMRLANLNKDYQEAIRAFIAIEEHLKHIPLNERTRYYFELGYAYFHSEQYENANKVWEKIQLHPFVDRLEKYSAKYFINIANIYLRFYETETVNHYLIVAEKIDKKSNTGVVRAKMDKKSLYQNNPAYFQSMKRAIESEKNNDSKVIYYTQLANAYLLIEKYDSCMQVLNEALEKNPNKNIVKFLKALTFYKLNMHKEARGLIQQTLKELLGAREKADFLFLLALNAKKNNNMPLVKATFSKLLKTPYRKAAAIELKNIE